MSAFGDVWRTSIRSVCLWAGAFALMALSSAVAGSPEFKLENPQSGFQTRGMGWSIAADGDTMIVGAPWTMRPGRVAAGTARVYVRDSMGDWVFQAELSASDAAHNGPLGVSVSVSGDTVIVGATHNPWGSGPGAAYPV